MSLNRNEIRTRLLWASKFFKDTKKYQDILRAANMYFESGGLNECKQELDKLPTKEQLLEQLLEKLKGKSVWKTLKRIQKGLPEYSYSTLKGLSSLMTHIVIECEKGNTEYRALVPSVLDEINKVAYNLK